MWYIYTIEYYSAIKKNEIISCAGKWMKWSHDIMEINQIQKNKGYHA
jgi:hypothetical protein